MKKIFLLLILLFSFVNCVSALEFSIENCENIENLTKLMSEKIKNNWHTTSADKGLVTVVKAKVDENGKFDNEMMIAKSSGSKEYDRNAQQAFLASIDKNDEMLRFYREFTFKNGTVVLTFDGLTKKESLEYRKKILDLSDWRSAVAFEDRDLLKNNAYIVFKTDKNGTVLNSEIINADGELFSNLKRVKDKVTSLPKLNNVVTDQFWVAVVYTKYLTAPFIELAATDEEFQKILNVEEWKSYCFQMIENMWKAVNIAGLGAIPAKAVISKDGYIKEFKFLKRRPDVAAFILQNVKLPPLTLKNCAKDYAEMIYFETGPLLGNYIMTGPLYSEAKWGPYMSELEKTIRSYWRPPIDNKSKRIVVSFDVRKNGVIENIKVTVSSGNKKADQAAIEAIEKTSPFKPLPEQYEGPSVPIEFTFDYGFPVRL